MKLKVPFNTPFITGEELKNIKDAVETGSLSGNGKYTKKCQDYLEREFGFYKCLLTNSCTDALEMAALLIDIQPGDEVIMPSYTFVSTANAFVLRGARIRFVDSRKDHPGMDEKKVEELITPNTKAIVVVHYAGVAVDMDQIMDIAARHNLYVVEDAAQALDSYYNKNKRHNSLGSIGHLSAFSFHETKNVISGEGGMLVINDEKFEQRAEIIWEKGTNRAAFFRGEVDKYGWVDIGSSFLPSEVTAAFLWAQLNNLLDIQKRRLTLWQTYYKILKSNKNSHKFNLPKIPEYATNNAHIFYLVCQSPEIRSRLISHLKDHNIHAVFHYLSLHKSKFYREKHDGRELEQCDRYANCLVRLPLFYELQKKDIGYITEKINSFS